MGYTQYWDICGWDTPEWQRVWPQLLEDTRLILEASDVLLSGSRNNNTPFTPPSVDKDLGIRFNGFADDSCETFILCAGHLSGCVKTNRRPYDLAVACVLLRAFLIGLGCVDISSNGHWTDKEWIDAVTLYKQLWPNERIKCPWREEDTRDIISPEEPTGSATMGESSTQDMKACELASLPPPSNEKVAQSTITQLDQDVMRKWLVTCDQDLVHKTCRAAPITWVQLPAVSLKVIDLERSCIVEAPEQCSFFALTYVWDRTKQPRLTEQTAPVLMQEGGIGTIWSDLPMTIRDAMLLCRRLKERYLWVDALCIKQDSLREVKIQILRMRQIYSTAKCTIAAVSAESADVGLLGTTENALPSDGTSSCETLEELEKLLESAPWSSRAWCYQEKVLSHRIIMFTSAGIYMHCQRNILTSTGLPLRRRDGTLSTSSTPYTRFDAVGSMLSITPGEDLESYVSAVEFYSKRHMTNFSDKQNAFQGIFKRYQGFIDGIPSAFSFGLPISAFDQTVCWRSRHHSVNSRNPAFPSWSWLGWQGGVEFDRKMIHAARTKQMIHPANSGPYPGHTASLRVRKPATFKPDFGFPGSGNGMFQNNSVLHLYASVVRLWIEADAHGDQDHGMYAIWATACCHSPPSLPKPRIRITGQGTLYQQLPEIRIATAEYVAAPCLPVKLTHEPNDLTARCSGGGVCIAKEPLGYISLDREWRTGQGKECVMEFMALAGEKDEMRDGQWVITMLMCLQRMEKKIQRFYERVQVVNCELSEQRWLETGAKNTQVDLV